MKQQTAKTPTVAIARVLRGLGLKQGSDFRVRGEYRGTGANRERIGTYVAMRSAAGEQTVADNADLIEELVKQDGGFAFRVSIHRTPSGRVWTWIANYGKRTREGHFMDTDADRKRMGLGAGTTGSDAPAEDTRKAVKDIEQRPGRTGAPVILDAKKQRAADALRSLAGQVTDAVAEATQPKPVIRVTLGAPRPAFPLPDADTAAELAQGAADISRHVAAIVLDAHPYDGLAQKPFGSLTWACEEAGQTWFFQNTRNSPRYTLRAYRGRVQANGWYLTGYGVAREGVWMGATLTAAAEAAQDTIIQHAWIAERMEAAGRDWPKGTRVRGLDSQGIARTGTVNGVDVGMVVEPAHDNYGRTFVGVNWDAPERPELGYIVRNRPFTDGLTRI